MMHDMEKVIKGLLIERECVSRDCDRDCGKCDLVQDRDWLLSVYDDALEMLKEQAPMVMTLGEIFIAQKKDTWYEIRNEETIHPLMLVETENSTKNQCAYFWPGIVAPIKGYGKTWRCWTARPTDEQREEAKWE